MKGGDVLCADCIRKKNDVRTGEAFRMKATKHKGGTPMKTRILVVFISVIGLSLMAGLGSAGPTSIRGNYALSGFSSCSVAGSPADPGILEADYTFNKDGTGSATGVVRSIPTPTVMYVTLEFTYTVTHGDIEFAYPSGGFKVYADPDHQTYIMQWDKAMSHGVISPDGKTMTISCGPPKVLTVIDSPLGPPVGTEGYCVTTLVGMRLH